MTQYQDLIERVKAATGSDRELDARLAVLGGKVIMRHHPEHGYSFFDADDELPRGAFLSGCKNGEDDAYAALGYCRTTPHFTESIDACAALIERKLPDWWWLREDGISIRLVGPDNGEYNPSSEGRHELVPQAMLLALLLALQSNEATNVEDK